MANGKLPPHHEAWLAAHPWRTEEWLKERTKDGFDVHHVDGNAENDSASNLVLIEHGDHMAIHNGGIVYIGRLAPRTGKRRSKARIARERKSTAVRTYETQKAALIDRVKGEASDQ